MKEVNDLVSIVVPVYNAERFINETIQTVLDQTYTNWELIFIDDASTDNSVKLITPYLKKDKRIKLLKNKINLHAALTRNKGIKAAKGRYIAFLDADDLWVPSKLKKQVAFMKKMDCAFSFTGYEFADATGKPNGKKVYVPATITYKQALKNTTIFTSTVMFDMTKLTKKTIEMPDIRRGQDTATWWKVLKTIESANGLNVILSRYRRTPGTVSSNKVVALKRTWNIYRHNEKLGMFHSIYYFIHYSLNAAKRRTGVDRHTKVVDPGTVQVLISTMNQQDLNSLIKSMRVNSAVVINQITDKIKAPKNIRTKELTTYSVKERGLSKSRNRAIGLASADICVIADDDMYYVQNYEDLILNAYKKFPDADIISFFVDSEDRDMSSKRMREGKVTTLKTMKISSYQISFKTESLIKHGLKMDESFGTGTNKYMGEENILLFDSLNKGLKIYHVPVKIATLRKDSISTWFTGYDEKYLKVKGMAFYRMSKRLSRFLILQFLLRKHDLYAENISLRQAYDLMNSGRTLQKMSDA